MTPTDAITLLVSAFGVGLGLGVFAQIAKGKQS